jgi:hypothetical protein
VFAELTGGREREPCELVEEVHAVVGRRSGKTRAAATLATYPAALVDHADRLAPGERAVLPLLSATTWQAQRAFHLIRGIFAEAPALASLIERRRGRPYPQSHVQSLQSYQRPSRDPRLVSRAA